MVSRTLYWVLVLKIMCLDAQSSCHNGSVKEWAAQSSKLHRQTYSSSTSAQSTRTTLKKTLPGHDILHQKYSRISTAWNLCGYRGQCSQQTSKNIDSTSSVIEAITTKLSSKQEKLLLLFQFIMGRIQHVLTAVTPSISCEFAQECDAVILEAVASLLDLSSLTQRKICDHGLHLINMEGNFEFLFQARFMRTAGTIQKSFPQFVP